MELYPTLFTYLKEIEHQDDNDIYRNICDMSFSRFSQIVLDTQNLILRTIDDALSDQNPQKYILLLRCSEDTILEYLTNDIVTNNVNCEDSFGSILPKIGFFDSGVIISYGSFYKFRNEVVSLGMKLAFKHLIRNNDTTVVVLRPISHEEHSQYFDGLLYNLIAETKSCLLGLINYDMYVPYNKLIFQKENWLREQNKISSDEATLSGSIDIIKQVLPFIPEEMRNQFEQELFEKEKRMFDLKTKRLNMQFVPTEKDIKLEKTIQNREAQKLEIYNCGKLIKFNNFTTSSNILNELIAWDIPAIWKQSLDFDDKHLIEWGHKKNLFSEINDTIHFYFSSNFIDDVKEQGLLPTLIQNSPDLAPHMADFFINPVMDPILIQKFNEEFINESIQSFLKKVIVSTNFVYLVAEVDEELDERIDVDKINFEGSKFDAPYDCLNNMIKHIFEINKQEFIEDYRRGHDITYSHIKLVFNFWAHSDPKKILVPYWLRNLCQFPENYFDTKAYIDDNIDALMMICDAYNYLLEIRDIVMDK